MADVDTSALADLSDEDFMTAWTDKAAEAAAFREALEEFSTEHQRRERKKQLEATMGGVSDEDIALLQEIKAEGIASEEEA